MTGSNNKSPTPVSIFAVFLFFRRKVARLFSSWSQDLGFTLIEVVVAVTIFTLVVVVASGSIISAVRAQKKAFEGGQMVNQLSYALEYMSRALRMTKKDLTGECLTAAGPKFNYQTDASRQTVRFVNFRGNCQEFLLDGGQIKERLSSNNSASNFGLPSPLTSNDINIEEFEVILVGQGQDDLQQPIVTFRFKVLPIAGGGPIFNIQTTISQRNIDVKR